VRAANALTGRDSEMASVPVFRMVSGRSPSGFKLGSIDAAASMSTARGLV
jgi:hypothetical protein